MILKQLKAEALNFINIHATLSSLRRECSRGKVTVVEETEDLPKLYYVTSDNYESINALNADLTRFLLGKHIESAGTGDTYLLKEVSSHWIQTEDDYNKYVDKDYRDKYSWEDSKATMPWLVINVVKNETAETASEVKSENEESEEPESTSKVKVNITFDSQVSLKDTVDKVGTVSEDRKSLQMDIDKYVMFEAVNDLGLTTAVDLSIKVDTDDALYSLKANI